MEEPNMSRCSACTKTPKDPVLLHCFHSFCKNCVFELNKTNNLKQDQKEVKQVICPVCKYETTILNDEINEYDLKDEFLNRFIQTLNIPLNIKQYCEVCQLVESFVKTLKYCLDCRQSLCNSCAIKHNNEKNSCEHDVTDVSLVLESAFIRMRRDPGICKQHQDVIKYFCMKCSMLACMQCSIEHHKKHWSVSIKEALHHMQNDVKTVANKLRDYHANVHSFAESFPAFYRHQAMCAKQDVATFFDKFVANVRQKQQQLQETIDKFYHAKIEKSEENRQKKKQTCARATVAYERLKLINRYSSETDLIDFFLRMKSSDLDKDLEPPMIECMERINIDQSASDIITSALNDIKLQITRRKGAFVKNHLKSFADEVPECSGVLDQTHGSENVPDSDVVTNNVLNENQK